MVDVKAKIKPITYVFVRENFRFKTIQNKVQPERLCLLRRTPSVDDVKAKIKPITYVFVRKNFVLKLYKTKFLSCNLKGCDVLRRIPSVVDVQAKIKPITNVFVRNNFRTKRS